jgi:hypothetical protein
MKMVLLLPACSNGTRSPGRFLTNSSNSRIFQEVTSLPVVDGKRLRSDFFIKDYLPERMELFRTRLEEHVFISDKVMRKAANCDWLAGRLEREFMKDSLVRCRDGDFADLGKPG